MIFQFHKCGVCLNPEVITIHVDGKNYSQVRLSMTQKRQWHFGYIIKMGNSAQEKGACLIGDHYAIREDALAAALVFILKICLQYDHREDYQKLAIGIDAFIENFTVKPML